MKRQAKSEKNLGIIIPIESIEKRIYLIRGRKVMLDMDLAKLYKVTTGNLNLAVRRNSDRFPKDFMFQIDTQEYQNLILQFAISSHGGRRHKPYAFTELGVAMLSSVLKSERAIHMNISIMRAFTKLREMLATNKELALKIEELERGQQKQGRQLVDIYSIIKRLINTPNPNKTSHKIGFNSAK